MIEKMKKLSTILLILFLLFIPITSSAQYSGRSLSEIKIIMNGALEIVGIKAKIIRVIRNLNTEKVDFYAQITTAITKLKKLPPRFSDHRTEH